VRCLRTSTLTVLARPWEPVSLISETLRRFRVNLARLAGGGFAMAVAQVAEQLHLLVVADGGVRVSDLDAGLGELREQAIDGGADDFSQLSYSDLLP